MRRTEPDVCNPLALPYRITLREFRRQLWPESERSLWRRLSAGDFPKPIARIGGKTWLWDTEVLVDWVHGQEKPRRGNGGREGGVL